MVSQHKVYVAHVVSTNCTSSSHDGKSFRQGVCGSKRIEFQCELCHRGGQTQKWRRLRVACGHPVLAVTEVWFDCGSNALDLPWRWQPAALLPPQKVGALGIEPRPPSLQFGALAVVLRPLSAMGGERGSVGVGAQKACRWDYVKRGAPVTLSRGPLRWWWRRTGRPRFRVCGGLREKLVALFGFWGSVQSGSWNTKSMSLNSHDHGHSNSVCLVSIGRVLACLWAAAFWVPAFRPADGVAKPVVHSAGNARRIDLKVVGNWFITCKCTECF